MPVFIIPSALVRSLLFILCITWILYIFPGWLVNDNIEYVWHPQSNPPAVMRTVIHLSLFILISTSLTNASPLHRDSQGPPAFLLAGDSTTAAQNCCGGGWGNGFLSTLRNGALGSNFGRNGATTVSFVADGEWADVLESVSRYRKSYTPYVTIAVRKLTPPLSLRPLSLPPPVLVTRNLKT